VVYLKREVPLFALLSLLIIFRLRGESLPPWVIIVFWLSFAAIAPKEITTPLIVALMVTLSLQLNTLWLNETPSLGLPGDEIVAVRGHLLDDSSTTINGNTMLRLEVRECENKRGDWATGRGNLVVITSKQITLYCGLSIECRGEVLEGGLFASKEVLSLSAPSRYAALRAELLRGARGRLEKLSERSTLLLRSLLLGESSVGGASLREMVTQSGCAHVLALSGMHLNSLILLFSSISGLLIGKRYAKWLALPVAFGYVALVGFKPSLVRSLLMLFIRQLVRGLGIKETLTFTFIAHLLLFPDGICSVASLLSYSCLVAILWGAEACASPFILFLPPKGALLVGTTLVATFALAPLSLMLFGAWYPIGLLLSPILATVALFLLTLAIIYLVVPWTPLKTLLEIASRLFYSLAEWGSSHTPNQSLWGWLGALALMLTILALLKYANVVIKKRYRQQYDLELSLQFPPRHH
jgi:competence protein ComEC